MTTTSPNERPESIRIDDADLRSDSPPRPQSSDAGGQAAPDRIEITDADISQANAGRPASPPQGNRIVLTDDDFQPQRPPQPPRTPPRRPQATPRPAQPSQPIVTPVATGTATVTAAAGASGAAGFFKALMLFIFLGAAGTAGFYAAREFGILDSVTMLGASPSAVVREYLERSEAGKDASSLLTADSKELFMPNLDPETAKLRSQVQQMGRDVRAANKSKSKWRIKSERIEGDKAWVIVEMQNPMEEYLGNLESQIEYNKAHGQHDAARINEQYLEEKKRQIAMLGGDAFKEGMRNMEQPFLCRREGGRWKVDLAGQMEAMFENLGKLFGE
jgi:hypothetical protein